MKNKQSRLTTKEWLDQTMKREVIRTQNSAATTLRQLRKVREAQLFERVLRNR